MWFRVLSALIGFALVVKAAAALASPRRFYAVRARQYQSERLSPSLLIPPAIVLTMTLAAWYATAFHYRPWGWIVTGSLTAVSCFAFHHLTRWSEHRKKMLVVVQRDDLRRVDAGLAAAGAGFLLLAFAVY